MARVLNPEDIRWDRFPAIAGDRFARGWLEAQVLLGLAPNTIDAYARAIQDFLSFCARAEVRAHEATREEIARYVGDLRQRPSRRGQNVCSLDSGAGLANATLQQRLTAVRLFFDHLIEEELRQTNPVGR